jgi:hypothetical protein
MTETWPYLPWRMGARTSTYRESVSVWMPILFSLGIALAFSPNIISVYGLHNDYEMINYKSWSFFHPEAEALFAIARPVAALLTNLPMLPVNEISDFRWTRIFSLLTVCVLGTQMISLCFQRLQLRALDAIAVALATFLVLPFIYSVINATAWPPHLLTVFLAFLAYGRLSDSNVLLLALPKAIGMADVRPLPRQAWLYFQQRPVWAACLIYQLALYDYPPNALILVVFPVIAVLMSRMSPRLRTIIAVRDLAFVCVNLVIFSLTAKAIYLPVVRLFTSLGTGVSEDSSPNPLAARLTATYHFDFNPDPIAALARLKNLLKVTGDLWFLPQLNVHVVVVIILAAAVILANVMLIFRRYSSAPREAGSDGLSRIAFDRWNFPRALAPAIPAASFLIASSPVLAAATGFVTYRTVAVSTAVVAIVFVFFARGVVGLLWELIGNPFGAKGFFSDATTVLIVCAAVAANFYANDLSMRLARNEFAYFTGIVRQAIANKSNTVIIIDPRPFRLPEDIPVVYDQKGRAVPPFELGCFSGYCLQTGSIVQIAARQFSPSADKLKVFSIRGGDPISGLTCDMLAPNARLPDDFSAKSIGIVNWYRSMAPLTCVTYNLDWHDIGIELSP